jgi:hypothetical protein
MGVKEEKESRFHALAMRLHARRELQQPWSKEDLKELAALGEEVLEPNFEQIAVMKAKVLDDEGKLVEGLRHYHECLLKNPESVFIRGAMKSLVARSNQVLTSMILNGGSVYESVALFETLIDLEEVGFTNLILMVEVYKRSGLLEKSESLKQKVRAVAPHHPAVQ